MWLLGFEALISPRNVMMLRESGIVPHEAQGKIIKKTSTAGLVVR